MSTYQLLRYPVLIASQITLAARREKERPPCAADLREAGNIGDDAFAVIMLYEWQGEQIVDIQYNRGGPGGKTVVIFAKHEQRWKGLKEEEYDELDFDPTD